jgi:hypothetical protein
MESVGSLVDRLSITNRKMWNVQDILYEIRRMSFEQFKEKYSTEKGLEELYKIFKDACELNYQRNVLSSDIDTLVIKIIKEALAGKDIDKYAPMMYKTY